MAYRLLIGLVASVAVVAGWARGWALPVGLVVAVGSAEIADVLSELRS